MHNFNNCVEVGSLAGGVTFWAEAELALSLSLRFSSLCASRNLREASEGLAEEINFEDFLTIMSNFRPIEMNMDEEQLDGFRKQKLKCN